MIWLSIVMFQHSSFFPISRMTLPLVLKALFDIGLLQPSLSI
jgi:hypothetical protein